MKSTVHTYYCITVVQRTPELRKCNVHFKRLMVCGGAIREPGGLPPNSAEPVSRGQQREETALVKAAPTVQCQCLLAGLEG